MMTMMMKCYLMSDQVPKVLGWRTISGSGRFTSHKVSQFIYFSFTIPISSLYPIYPFKLFFWAWLCLPCVPC